jgi:hypothetical protein
MHALLAALIVIGAPVEPAQTHGKEYWRAIVAARFEVPAGASAQQNVRHLLTALWTELSVDERPSEGADFAKQALGEVLKVLF